MSRFSIKGMVDYALGPQWLFYLLTTILVGFLIFGALFLGRVANTSFFNQLSALDAEWMEDDRAFLCVSGYMDAQGTWQQEVDSIFLDAQLHMLVQEHWLSLLITFLCEALFIMGIVLGIKKLVLNKHDADRLAIRDLFSCFHRAPMACLVVLPLIALFLGVIIFIIAHGFIVGNMLFLLLYVPLFLVAFYFLIRLRFTLFAIADNHSAFSALVHSWRLTKGSVIKLALLQMLLFFLMTLCAFSIPVFLMPIDLILAHTYRTLEDEKYNA